MTIHWKQLLNYSLIGSISLLTAACVAAGAIPASNSKPAAANTTSTAAPSTLCNIEGQQVQDLSDGTTTATITQSCQETVVFIQNKHPEHPKRCQVAIGSQASELYIRPGESRSLTQTGPVAKNTVNLKCVNDWNRPR